MDIQPHARSFFNSFVSVSEGGQKAIVKSYGPISALFQSLLGNVVKKTDSSGVVHYLDKKQVRELQRQASVLKASPMRVRDMGVKVKEEGEIKRLLSFQTDKETQTFKKTLYTMMKDINLQSKNNVLLEEKLDHYCRNQIAILRYPDASAHLKKENNQLLAEIVQIKGALDLIHSVYDFSNFEKG